MEQSETMGYKVRNSFHCSHHEGMGEGYFSSCY